MKNEIYTNQEPEVTQYWRGLTRIDGVTRAVIDVLGNLVIVDTIEFATKRVYSTDLIWYSYDQNLSYFIPDRS
ncbi:MAG TPA: hypothetical protein PKJ26_03670 [Candidatus Woesebacteria bacterium]|nr:hypothetical protein [Candidatus Woesebacteria bacterium]HNS65568.1 hypothetical protein [Candidatus Woesebacteria bacterium]